MRKILPFVMAAMLFTAACSSDKKTSTTGSSSSSSSSGAAPVALSGTTNDHGSGDATSGALQLEVDNYYFNPTYIKVTPGGTVKLTVKNEGSIAHTFTSAALNIDQQVDPGKQMDITVTLPANLPVEFHCRFHQGQGMQGALFVTAGSAVPGANAPAGSSPAASASSSSSSSTDAGYYN